MPLRPCASCHRHVRSDSRTCPFCDARVHLPGALLIAGALALGGCDKDTPSAPATTTSTSSGPEAPDPKPEGEEGEPETTTTSTGTQAEIEVVPSVYAGPPPDDGGLRGPEPELEPDPVEDKPVIEPEPGPEGEK